jgi:hypothetical protein
MIINEKQVIVIYAGRFQPMGRHHKMTYDWCVKNFGSENVLIVSSNKVDPPKSPLSFIEKQAVAIEHGVPDSRVILAFVVGQKDMKDDPRFKVGFTKKNRPTYFQHFISGANMKSGLEHGYLLVAPHMEYLLPNKKESSGTNLRKFLANASPDEFEMAMGFWDEELYNLFKEKFLNTPYLMPEGIKRKNRNDEGYGSYLEEIMNELQHIKKEYGSRRKEGYRYRKEASKIQDAYSEIRKLKKDHDRRFTEDQMLSERLVRAATGHDDYEDKDKLFNRDCVREFFDKFK